MTSKNCHAHKARQFEGDADYDYLAIALSSLTSSK